MPDKKLELKGTTSHGTMTGDNHKALWSGRFAEGPDAAAVEFETSIHVDERMALDDIAGSRAHAAMLCKQGILSVEENLQIQAGLTSIADDLERGALSIDYSAEDIHSFVEATLTDRIGEPGKKLHTGRSRNDQIALDERLYLRRAIPELQQAIRSLIGTLADIAASHTDSLLTGYTHMQHAQPVTLAQHLCAWSWPLARDLERLSDSLRRIDKSPLGSGALAGSSLPLDREAVASSLGFAAVTENSLDSVSDRDYCIEFASDFALLQMHLSRMSEEVVLWATTEFGFIDLSEKWSTGSSIMPQKKNPDVAELVRGKTGRVYGSLITLLTVMKGIPLAYNKDMQEDKEPVFDAIDTVELCVPVFAAMIQTMTVQPRNMRQAASGGFINATDCADYLTRKGMPFREAYMIVGRLVNDCLKSGDTLDTLTLRDFRAVSGLFDGDIYDALSMQHCVNDRAVMGGPAETEVLRQIEYIESFADEHRALLPAGDEKDG